LSTAVLEPENLEAEEHVIGACLLSEVAVDKASDFLEPGHFYRQSHGAIFAALVTMRRRGDPIDVLMLSAELERLGALAEVGGKSRLAELAALVPAAGNVGHYAALVLEAARARAVYRTAQSVQKAALNGGLTLKPELVDEMRAALDEASMLPGEPALPPGPLFVSAHEFAATDFEPPEPLLGTEECAVVVAGGLGLLAGRPGTGKTTLVLDLACHLAAGEPWPPSDPDTVRSSMPAPWPCPRPLNVAVIVNEGPQEMFRAKVQDKLTRFPHSIREAGGSVHIQTFNWGTFSFADRSIHDRLRSELDEKQIDLVIGDPLASLGLEGVGSPKETLDFVNLLKPLGLGTYRSFLFLHHFRERTEAGEDEVGRLSGAWGGHLDTLLTLSATHQKSQSRFAYPKLRWSSVEPVPIILARIINLRGFEAIGEEGDAGMLEPQIAAYLHESREANTNGKAGWQLAGEIAKGIEARPTAVRKALEGAPHLFALATGAEAKMLGAKSAKAKLWGIVEWDIEAPAGGNPAQDELAVDPPAGDDIPF
jgi:hypothetical protein